MRVVLYLRRTHREALGLDEFLCLGLIGLSYGIALLIGTYAFLAVFAAGLAVRRIERTAAEEPESGPRATRRRTPPSSRASCLRSTSASSGSARSGW